MDFLINDENKYDIVSRIFKLKPSSDFNHYEMEILINFMIRNNYKAPYPEITSFVYNESEKYEFGHVIISTEEALTNYLDRYYSSKNDTEFETTEEYKNIKSFIEKFIRHATLAHIQYQHFKRQIDEANKLLLEIKQSRDNIYTDFIAILGVFSSFVFVMFSGFSGLTSILTNLGDVSVSISRTVFIAAILMAFIISIIYVLLLWVSRIIGKDISGKINSVSEHEIKNKLYSLFLRHRFYLCIMIILSILSVISLTLILFGIN